MKHVIVAIGIVALIGGAQAAFAQEQPGAGRWEVGIFPGGGTFFTKGSSNTESSFKNYALGVSVAWNANRLFGVEGELGAGLGLQQTIDFKTSAYTGIKSPNTVAYDGNLVYAPYGSDQALVPYLTAGIGGLSLRSSSNLQSLFGLQPTQSFFTQNLGAGVKWYSSHHWGLRGDYRFFIVDGKSSADPFFGLNNNRYGSRVYGSILLSY
jgi:Outer membrane protein beta-barrel domain